MSKPLLFGLALLLAPAPVFAASVPPEFVSQVEALVGEVEGGRAGRSNKACGGHVLVSYEVRTRAADGAESAETLSPERHMSWGCNGTDVKRKGTQGVAQKLEHSVTDPGGRLTVCTATVVLVLNYDRQSSVKLSGGVTDGSGKPVRGAEITAYNLYTDEIARGRSDGKGRYAIGMGSGLYRLQAKKGDSASATDQRLLCAFGASAPGTGDAQALAQDFVLGTDRGGPKPSEVLAPAGAPQETTGHAPGGSRIGDITVPPGGRVEIIDVSGEDEDERRRQEEEERRRVEDERRREEAETRAEAAANILDGISDAASWY